MQPGTVLVVQLLDGAQTLCEVINPNHYGGIRVKWLPGNEQYTRCWYQFGDRPRIHPIEGTLPPTPDTQWQYMGYDVPSRWKLAPPA